MDLHHLCKSRLPISLISLNYVKISTFKLYKAITPLNLINFFSPINLFQLWFYTIVCKSHLLIPLISLKQEDDERILFLLF